MGTAKKSRFSDIVGMLERDAMREIIGGCGGTGGYGLGGGSGPALTSNPFNTSFTGSNYGGFGGSNVPGGGVYGSGSIKRDFTYIDDIVNSMVLLSNELDIRPKGYNDLVNIGGGKPISMSQVIEQVEKQTGVKIGISKLPANKLDLQETCADFTYLNSLINQKPSVSFEIGLEKTIEWASNNEIKVRIKILIRTCHIK